MGASAAFSACGAKSTAQPTDTVDDELAAAGSNGKSSSPEDEPSERPPRYSCERGQPSTFCLGPEQMEHLARYGVGQIPLEPPRSDAEVAAAFLDNGCLRHDWTASSCCNPALGPGVPNAEGQCCYQSCEGVCCGRALVLNDRALVSQAEQRNDWLVPDATLTGLPYVPRPVLTAAERARLVELWRADALMEHASIASFARFSLQLLALGAPAQLVHDAQAAALDEIKHAEHAFSIASRLAGRAIGPGPLPELNAPLQLELRAVIRATLVEGCIGETLAAVVAQEQALKAGDPTARKALLDVAEDETRHAELGFRFVAWALTQGGPELRAALRAELEPMLTRLPEPSSTEPLSPTALHYYGRLTVDEQRALYRQAREQILRPALAALFEGAPRRRSVAPVAATKRGQLLDLA